MVVYLLKNGALANIKTRDGATAKDLALIDNHENVIKILEHNS